MKKFLSFIAIAMLSIGVCASCSPIIGDDEDGNLIGGGDNLTEGQWYEDGNVLRYKEAVDGYSCVWEFTFSGDSCTKAICKCTFADDMTADAFYQGMASGSSGLYTVSKSGKTVTIDYTNAYRGLSKAALKAAIGYM